MTKKKQQPETPLTIARMIIRNYIVIQEMSMVFGKFNKITAANRRGKTSILKAIREAFKSSGIDPSLIHDGEDEAEIIVELTDGVNIERKITQDKNNVKVTIDDQRVTAPTVFLKELLGSGGQLSFDPTQYFLADEAEKRRLLLSALPITVTEKELAKLAADKGFDIVWKLIKLIDIDFDQHGLTVLDKIGKLIYERRAEQNIHVTRLTKALEQDRRELPETVDAEQYRGFKLDGAMELLQTMERQVKELDGNIVLRDELQEEIEGTGVEIKEQADFIESLKNQIAGAEQAIVDLRALKQNKQRAHKAITKKVNAFDAPDVDGQREYIRGFEASQAAVIKLGEIERRETKLGDDKKLHYMLDEFYKYFNTRVTS
jgi:predicted ATP-dependent endonuclease of OLD family